MTRRLTFLLLVLAFPFAGSSNNLGNSPALQLQERAREQAAYEKQTQARIAQLARMEAARLARDQLALSGTEARRNLQAAKSAAWTSLIAKNWQLFEALRKLAAFSPEGEAACTICDGLGSMNFCLLCEHSGKCVACQGSGKTPRGQDCPACRGSGKCYLCFGSGNMLCPFCDDGFISSKGPPPPAEMPVLVETPVRLIPPPGAGPAQQHAGSSLSAPIPVTEVPAQSEAVVAPPEVSPQNFGIAVALLLAGIFSFRKLAPRIGEFLNSRFNPRGPRAPHVPSDALAEERGFSEFIAAFQAGLGVSTPHSFSHPFLSRPDVPIEKSLNGPQKKGAPPRELLRAEPEQFARLRGIFSEISRTPDEAARQKLLGNLSLQVGALKVTVATSELLPAWQLASALEGLLNQLAAKASNVNPSGLRSAAAALDLLEALSVSGLRPDLLTNPPVRLLAVDDDPIIRHAISFALKKALNQPDLATDGKAALVMVEQHRYDVVFLDVEMPGMGGFELCTKIQETVPNRTTPVVFVTNHSDFNARARSALTGAHDLIGKPFLTFEITLKALTLVLRARLEKLKPARSPAQFEELVS